MPKHKKHVDQDDSDGDQDDDSDNQFKLNTDNSPKIIPVAKLPDKLKYKKIVLNVSDTQYPIITEIGEELGWIIQDQEGTGDWDVWWTDREIQPNTLYRMNLHQKINHFPGIYVLARKNLLGLHLMGMQKKFPNDYNFFPQTWMLPMQFPQFRQYYQSVQQGKVRTYIVKPEALSQGRGIFLTRNIEDVINGHKYVVQRYLKNPLLLDGLKFDLRIYVLLAGSQPLRLYIYEQGLARLATRPYQQPTAQNLHQNFIHLTNYSLNKSNPDYIYNKSDKQMDVGHKRSLKGVYQKLGKNGVDIQKLKTQIEDCIIKTVISGLPSIRHQYTYCQPQQYQGNMCFHILGFDVMILDDLKPIVIQVNHTPSFETGTPLDYQIKKNLIKDTLKLMRITSKQKKALFYKSKQLTKRRIQTGKRDILKGQERKQHLQKIQKVRDSQEHQILFNSEKPNGYKAIFPFKDQKKNQLYAKFYQGAEKIMKQLKDMRKKIISEQVSVKQQVKPNNNKNNPHSRNQSSVKEASMESKGPKKTSLAFQISNRSIPIKNKDQNMEGSSNSNGSNQKINKQLQFDVVVEAKQKSGCEDSTSNSHQNHSDAYLSQKKFVYSSPGNSTKNNFHIRNNTISRKGSLNSQGNQRHVFSPNLLEDQQLPKTQITSTNNKYQKLIDKLVKSKDLNQNGHKDPRISIEGQFLIEQKLNGINRQRLNKDQNIDQQDELNVQNFLRIKQKVIKQKQILTKNNYNSIIKSFKNQKIAINISTNQTKYQKQKFYDSHLLRIQNTVASKNGRNESKQGNKPSTMQNYISHIQNQSILFVDGVISSVKQSFKTSNNKNDNKPGKFLKPKTFNLHQSKFPQQDKLIVRTNPSINFNLHGQTHQTNINMKNISNNSGATQQLKFLQYKEYVNSLNTHNNSTTNQTPVHGYAGKNKIHVNQRQITSFVNIKPSTTQQKYKSNSVVYTKPNSNPPKDNLILMKLIDKSKIKGYH